MLLTGVRERVAEIGLRRALGARRSEIAGLFVAEALALTGARPWPD
jgi:ABC-type antimicrobial peptide transport system permease subunit